MSRVKIVATIGPRTNNAEAIRELAAAGMGVARLNGSHSDLAWHAAAIALLRRTLPDTPILLDIPGKKIRTRALAFEPSFSAGGRVVLTTGASDADGRVPINSATLHGHVGVGDTILADDGTLRFTVVEVVGCDIVCRAENAGTLRSAKGINVPTATMPVTGLSERDREMLSFAREHGVDFVGISFVDQAHLVQAVRAELGADGPLVLSKVENLGAMNNLDEVIEASDAIMIDRGDLSVETNLESIALYQKRILAVSRRHGKPVVVATEMLHSMITSPMPTKAEVTDISNAVLDGAAALMLSGETAVGAYPVEAVKVMRRIADTVAESAEGSPARAASESIPQAMGEGIALLCDRLPITKIVAITVSGYAARAVANFRPSQPLLVVSNNVRTARSANLLFGAEGVLVDIPFSRTSTDHVAHCLRELWRMGKLLDEDLVLVTSVGYPKSGNRMNLIQTHLVSDLRQSLQWSR